MYGFSIFEFYIFIMEIILNLLILQYKLRFTRDWWLFVPLFNCVVESPSDMWMSLLEVLGRARRLVLVAVLYVLIK